ncbi:MAG: hypothetical protein JSV74_01400, partial [Dehalococcoidia bacterium]
MKDQFEEILNECIERLLLRGESIEDCLKLYPDQASKLKPILEIALITKRTTAIEPRPEFKAKARYQFHLAIQDLQSNKGRFFSRLRLQWATALTAILILLLSSSGIYVAANNSIPGNPLYSVKLAIEQVQINLTFSDVAKANLLATLADRRVNEIIQLAKIGATDKILESNNYLSTQLGMVAAIINQGDNYWQNNALLGQKEQAGSEFDDQTTRSPEVVVEPPLAESTVPPVLGAGEEEVDYFYEYNAYSKVFTTLLNDMTVNLETLKELLPTLTESAQSAINETINTIEAGYSIAIDA